MHKTVILSAVVAIALILGQSVRTSDWVPKEEVYAHDNCSEKLNKLSEDIQRLDTLLKQLQQRHRREEDRRFATKYAAAKPAEPPIRVLGIGSHKQEYRIR